MAVAVACSAYQHLLQQLAELSRAAADLPPAAVADSLQQLACSIRATTGLGLPVLVVEEPSTTKQTSYAAAAEEEDGDLGPSTSAGHLTDPSPARPAKKKQRREKPQRELDFARYRQRYVALEVMYIGGPYSGFARQETSDNTIEAHLFAAMRKTKLIAPEVDVNELKYSRCGRTDKGVSALGQVGCIATWSPFFVVGDRKNPASAVALYLLVTHQVIALNLRSCGKTEEGEVPEDREMDYPRILNRALPPEIRVLGWTTVPADFNARFCALYRQYKYFIVQEQRPGQWQGQGAAPSLDLGAMREAARHFLGEHDFRNFCKPDVASVRSFVRKIHILDIEPVDLKDGAVGMQVYALNIRGTAFLWHQVRNMASVLLMVGRGQESPDIVRKLLDLEVVPCKPQYHMAPEEPLLLYACAFEGLQFRRTERAVENTAAVLSATMHRHLIAVALASSVLSRLHSDEKVAVQGETCGHVPAHMPLLKRQREPSILERAKKLGMTWPPPDQDQADVDDAMD